jgi:hypothetical protein
MSDLGHDSAESQSVPPGEREDIWSDAVQQLRRIVTELLQYMEYRQASWSIPVGTKRELEDMPSWLREKNELDRAVEELQILLEALYHPDAFVGEKASWLQKQLRQKMLRLKLIANFHDRWVKRRNEVRLKLDEVFAELRQLQQQSSDSKQVTPIELCEWEEILEVLRAKLALVLLYLADVQQNWKKPHGTEREIASLPSWLREEATLKATTLEIQNFLISLYGQDVFIPARALELQEMLRRKKLLLTLLGQRHDRWSLQLAKVTPALEEVFSRLG